MHDRTNFFKGKKTLLHFAPEKFLYSLFSKMPDLDYIPCDLFPELFMYKGKTEIRRVDITAIPFPDNTFDVILCNHVLEHIPDDRKAMRELHRVMKPDGWAILQVPINYKLEETYEDFSITSEAGRKEAFGQKDHVRWYGKDYKNRLSSVGFTVNEDSFVQNFSESERFKYGFREGELIYFCKK
jgi:SAM-dependent methyltransferase